MNEVTGNSTSEMLHLYLDGELDYTSEKVLFSELSVNEDLRSEMRELLAIKDSIHSDTEAFTPPLESAGVVFSSLGLSLPSTFYQNPANTSAALGSNFVNKWKKIGVPIISALISSIITYFLVTDYFSSAKNESVRYLPRISAFEENGLNHRNSYFTEFSGDELINESANKLSKNNKNNVNIVSSSNKVLNSVGKAFLLNENDNKINNIENIVFANNVSYERNDYTLDKENNNLNNSFEMADYNSIIREYKTRDKKYSFQIRGLQGVSFPNISKPPVKNSVLANLGIALYMNPIQNFRVGMEMGYEPFGLSFTNIEETGPFSINRNELYYWAGLGLQYQFDKKIGILGNSKPFIQLLLGGAEIGPIGKFITGLQYYSEELGLSAMLGAEATWMAYINQNRWYNSYKLGFTYGLSFHF